jgi:hypothetical protein
MSKKLDREMVSDYLTFAFIIIAVISIFFGAEIKNASADSISTNSSAVLHIATVSGSAGSLR